MEEKVEMKIVDTQCNKKKFSGLQLTLSLLAEHVLNITKK